MSSKLKILKNLQKLSNGSICRNFSSSNTSPSGTTGTQTAAPSSSQVSDVPGLSSAVVKYGKEPVGPGAAKHSDYKNPEYFCYNKISYFEAEIEMAKYRCPQPSSKKK